jgi:hypothetical protein
MNYWASVFTPWVAPFDGTYWGAISAHMADSVVMEDNFVAGAQRVGILYNGGLCPNGSLVGSKMNHSIKGNIVHSSLAGVAVFPSYSYNITLNTKNNLTCLSITNFVVFKSAHWGIYYQNPSSVIIDSNILVDNKVGIAALTIGPDQSSHRLTGYTIQISNSILIGRSASFNCSTDLKPDDFNSQNAVTIAAYGAGPTEVGNIGMVMGTFLGASNTAPRKPWYILKFYSFMRFIYKFYFYLNINKGLS